MPLGSSEKWTVQKSKSITDHISTSTRRRALLSKINQRVVYSTHHHCKRVQCWSGTVLLSCHQSRFLLAGSANASQASQSWWVPVLYAVPAGGTQDILVVAQGESATIDGPLDPSSWLLVNPKQCGECRGIGK